MKMRIIRLAISLTSLVASFLPQKAEALWCSITCPKGECSAIGWRTSCTCDAAWYPVCSS